MYIEFEIEDAVEDYVKDIRKNPYKRLKPGSIAELCYVLLDTLNSYEDMAKAIHAIIIDNPSIQTEFDELYEVNR